MENYGMAAPDDDNTIDCYQQYVAQTGYSPERPDDFRNQAGYNEENNGGWFTGESNNNFTSENCGASTTMSGRRYPRNGLYSQEKPRAGGDFYNSLPGVGTYPLPERRHERRYWF